MNYIFELSVDIRKNSNISEIKDIIASIAFDYNANINNFIYETEGHGNKIEKNDYICILSIDDNINKLIEFIKIITKIKYIHIDCIYSENNKIAMLYKSKKYQYKDDVLTIQPNTKIDIKDKQNELCNKIKRLIK